MSVWRSPRNFPRFAPIIADAGGNIIFFFLTPARLFNFQRRRRLLLFPRTGSAEISIHVDGWPARSGVGRDIWSHTCARTYSAQHKVVKSGTRPAISLLT